MEFSWRFRGVFVGFSWLRIIAPKAFSHAWPVFVGFSWDFRGPTKNEISGIIGEFSWLFRGRRYPASNRKHAQAHCLRKHRRDYFSEPSAFPITRFSCKRTVTTKFPPGFVRGRARFAFACSVAHRSMVAGPTAQRDNVLASKCEYPAFRYPPPPSKKGPEFCKN